MEAKYDADLVTYLHHIKLLSGLPVSKREELTTVITQASYPIGGVIFQQGDVTRSMILIKTGRVSLIKNDPDSKEQEVLAEISVGEYYGEQALLNPYQLPMTVQAMEDVVCWILNAEDLYSLVDRDELTMLTYKRKAVREGNYTDDEKHDDRDYVEATPENVNLLKGAVHDHRLFDTYSDQLPLLLSLMWRENIPKGHEIITQAQSGDSFYLVETGRFEVWKKGDDGVINVVNTSERGTIFGVSALMHRAPRKASVVASTDSVVWVVDRNTYRRFVMTMMKEKVEHYADFLKTVPLLKTLRSTELQQLAEALEEVSFHEGDTIMNQGEEGHAFYIIQKGEVRFYDDNVHVNTLFGGQYFGARALLEDLPRSASARCATDSKCLELNREVFNEILGPLKDLMNRRRSRGPSITETTKQRIREVAAQVNSGYDLDKLIVVKNLGVGSYGLVQLVRYEPTGEYFALKRFSKQALVESDDFDQVVSEKKLLSIIEHPFIVKLHSSFKDDDHVYLLIDVCLGGDLFGLLRTQVSFGESAAQFYAASIVLCFEYIHSKKIIHRDLKPENILIDTDGFIKLVDFGLAKVLRFRTFTLCGTPCYIAPEMLRGVGHGRGVDWWTLGILIYELLAGYTPFDHNDPNVICNKVIEGKYGFPNHFSKYACDLIKRLLNPKPTRRLGVIKGGAKMVKRHKWFKNIDWAALEAKQVTPPFIPEVSGPEDVSNFDTDGIEDTIIPFSGDESIFEDF